MTKNDRAIIDKIKKFSHSEELEIDGELKSENAEDPEEKDKQITLMKLFGFKRNNVSRWLQEEDEGICDENKIGFEQLSHFRNYVQSTKFKEIATKKDLLAKFASHLLIKQFEILTGETVEYHLQAVQKLRSKTKKATLFMCQSEAVFISITSPENLHEIIAVLFNPQSSTKEINLSLNQELLLDAINTIESYAYSDGGNFRDVLKIKLFVPTYTVFANIMAGTIEGELVGLIQDDDNVFVEMSDIGKSLVRCEIETQLHQKPAWTALPELPALRMIERLRRNDESLNTAVFDDLVSLVQDAENNDGDWLELLNALLPAVAEAHGNGIADNLRGQFQATFDYLKFENNA